MADEATPKRDGADEAKALKLQELAFRINKIMVDEKVECDDGLSVIAYIIRCQYPVERAERALHLIRLMMAAGYRHDALAALSEANAEDEREGATLQ